VRKLEARAIIYFSLRCYFICFILLNKLDACVLLGLDSFVSFVRLLFRGF
jgi:hypothetical protein